MWKALGCLTSGKRETNKKTEFLFAFSCHRRSQHLEKRAPGDQCMVQRSVQESDVVALGAGSVKIASERTVASVEPVKI